MKPSPLHIPQSLQLNIIPSSSSSYINFHSLIVITIIAGSVHDDDDGDGDNDIDDAKINHSK